MSLFSLFISWSPPLSFTLSCSLSVWISLTLSVYYVLCHRSPSSSLFSLPPSPSRPVSVFVVVHWVYGLKSNTQSLCKETFYCYALYLILWPFHRPFFPLPFLSSSSSLFIQLKQCDSTVLMQHHANCQKPSREHSPTLEYSTESNLAGVTEVRLECSHFSTGIMLFMLMASQLRPRKWELEEDWLDNPPLRGIALHYAFSFYLYSALC